MIGSVIDLNCLALLQQVVQNIEAVRQSDGEIPASRNICIFMLTVQFIEEVKPIDHSEWREFIECITLWNNKNLGFEQAHPQRVTVIGANFGQEASSDRSFDKGGCSGGHI